MCYLTDRYDEESGAPIVDHGEDCYCPTCDRCLFKGPACLGWYIEAEVSLCPACQDDCDEEVR